MADPPFRALADTMSLGMAFQVLVAPGGANRRFIFVSESCQALNGVSAADAMVDPKALYNLIAPEYRERLTQAETEASQAGGSFDVELAFNLANGETRWNRIASARRAVPWPDGSILWDGIQIDITERKRGELALEEQRNHLALAVEATGLGFWRWEPGGDRLIWSDRNKALFGLPSEAPIDITRYMAAVHPDDREHIRQAYRTARDRPEGGDFSMEYRAVAPDGQIRWILAHARVVYGTSGSPLVVGTSLDVTERRGAEDRQALLTREMAHRAKNGLAIVTALAQQTARGVTTVVEYEELLTSRLTAMSHSQDLITQAGGGRLGLADLLRKVLEPFILTRFDLDPRLEDVELSSEIGIGAALLLHELATNAVKYGALSRPEGRVAVSALELTDGLAQVEWRETGGPPPGPVNKSGFGTRLMQAALRNQGGKVEPRYEPEGLRALLEIPTVAG
ncbi:sensor histidine kinase [Phenylobacterium sp.]|uniref:sensor histidine kinase n=1 Tax=Phenylobacterium sp. TaxID=1871053 RepID=UPI0027326ED0|nr:PAS domain-containing protein [Phenylobacterium sp.]MDP3853822.1 PAS domain-containing protein [Phenylobacterium sp.]